MTDLDYTALEYIAGSLELSCKLVDKSMLSEGKDEIVGKESFENVLLVLTG